MTHKAVGYVLLRSICSRATSVRCRASKLDHGPYFWASLDWFATFATYLVLVHLADIQRWPRNSHHVLHQTYRIPTQLPVDDVELDIDFVVSKDTNDAARPALVVIGLP
ncbi:hypothetical protein SCLCIDRAFT_1219764 [Scleroderma citrinum Foug A]|uniref:Uncharacterized protein n=1 Tax=Scleroderma citrinum Foug A TaxID=1036808 RepID=A0A0C3DM40_9AGAM|nr:hypothetical protein SCLCIDRAFT_1219764 [Scleroderma citrinum Foug A]